MEIQYIESNEKDLDLIRPLWEKLKEQHEIQSHHFPEHYSRLTFNLRRKDLLKKSRYGALRLDIAKDSDSGEYIGYCVSTISKEKQGEIDSIYVEPNYRRIGVGDNLTKGALHWMDNMSVKSKVLVVAGENEEVLRFYSRYSFYPKNILLEQVKNKEKDSSQRSLDI